MKNLRNRFERFCFRHRNWGIPNLMMFVLIGNGILYFLSMMDIAPELPGYLYFDKHLILQGQIWRLVTYVFLDFRKNAIFMILFLYVYYSISRQIESIWGTLRFNLFYFSGIILTDIFGMVANGNFFTYPIFAFTMATYLHMSLFMAYATLHPDSGFLMFFIIPVKGWILVLVDLVMTGYSIYELYKELAFFGQPLIFCLIPLIALVNYALFFGADMVNILPPSWRRKIQYRKRRKPAPVPTTIPFSPSGTKKEAKAAAKAPYNHKCTICGRTDVTNPELEFRYCSRCNGYYCYCEEHITNHSHIQ